MQSEFFKAYVNCGFWVKGIEITDEKFDPKTYARMESDCRLFLRRHPECDNAQGGHDFMLTRNRHGAGFWCRPEVWGKENAERYTATSHLFGEFNLYIGDDTTIYRD